MCESANDAYQCMRICIKGEGVRSNCPFGCYKWAMPMRCDNTRLHIVDTMGVLHFFFFDAVCILCTDVQAGVTNTVVSCCLFVNCERVHLDEYGEQ